MAISEPSISPSEEKTSETQAEGDGLGKTPSPPTKPVEDTPSYVKLAMRNMVKKGAKSLFHFTLSAVGLLGLLVGLAYLTR
ncbi:MAG: DUF3285 domain-containing protein [Leptolyngbyaceae bacterium]|nr:DUF3285 domain-containing protein [Leptolyngbyaceae bacterium]